MTYAGGNSADPEDVTAPVNADNGDTVDADTASTDLPAFLTDDEPEAVALNGAAAS
jgi:hypothetical protein